MDLPRLLSYIKLGLGGEALVGLPAVIHLLDQLEQLRPQGFPQGLEVYGDVSTENRLDFMRFLSIYEGESIQNHWNPCIFISISIDQRNFYSSRELRSHT